ncbi:phage tail protein [Salmonella enterica]|uniref:Phage tail protein n=1 Tax=Salmonella enterica subsp. enterica serovar Cotham TaxID=2572724 RepID=A0A5Z7W7R4_SALET|nr:phage tail protein [Salmonella enterica subsp. enterica serovar Cotham]ECT9336899.1 phage tail protein [Salmonella enterica subsp. enterica serovar Cotham]EDU4469559.1 phage tail protein [Salmonella enterica subsp. enterica serovar Cotham]EHG9580009.1 phage tail protein [Salmonella enterica]EHP0353582.1 phage tail protein [Salmonella enterica]
MAINNFKAFALDPNANVTSQADWEALPALLSGFTAGKASSAQVNKAIRQATTIAALVGQFIANSGADALDNADVNGLVTKFTNALIANLRLGAGAPAIGIPFFWPSSAMPNTVMDEWADMVFLKFNGATFSASAYPKLALVFPSLQLNEARGEFLRIWDDGRGVDSGRGLLTTQSDLMKQFTLQYYGPGAGVGTKTVFSLENNRNAIYTSGINQSDGSGTAAAFNVPGGAETRPRNIAFNFLVRAK